MRILLVMALTAFLTCDYDLFACLLMEIDGCPLACEVAFDSFALAFDLEAIVLEMVVDLVKRDWLVAAKDTLVD